VGVGTLDEGHGLEPDVHIYTGSKVGWVVIPEGAEVYEEYYDVGKVWGREADERRYEVLEGIKRARKAGAEGVRAPE